MPQYKVLAKNNISKSATGTEPARWLEPGEIVEMDERTAREEFPGRLATLDGQVVRKDSEADALAALTVVLQVRRPHERVSLLEERLASTAETDPVRPRLQELLDAARSAAADDQKRHETRAAGDPTPARSTPPPPGRAETASTTKSPDSAPERERRADVKQ